MASLRARVVLTVCVSLVVAATPASADKCTAVKLKAIGKTESGLLACQAKVAAKGDDLAACEAKVATKLPTAFGKAGSCVGVEAVCEDLADNCESAVAAALTDSSTPGAPSKCEGAKRNAAGKLVKSELGCYAKAALKAQPLDPSCITKAESQFLTALTKAGTCPDGGSPQTLVEGTCVMNVTTMDGNGMVATLCGEPVGGTTTTTTVAATTTSTTTDTTPSTSTSTITTTTSTTSTTLISGSAVSVLQTTIGGVPNGIGSVEIFFAPTFPTGYMNVVIDLDGNGLDPGTDPAHGGDWWVQNRLLAGAAGSEGVGVAFAFPLGTMTPSGSYDVYASFTATPVTTPSVVDMVLTSQISFGSYDIGDLTTTGDPELVRGVGPAGSSRLLEAAYGTGKVDWLRRMGDAFGALLAPRAHAQVQPSGETRLDVPGFFGGTNACAPSAAVQSLLWFSHEHALTLPVDAATLVDKLKTAMAPSWHGGIFPGVNALNDDYLNGKNAVVQELGLPIATTASQTNLWDFITSQMSSGGADVEVFLASKLAGTVVQRHMVTVAGWSADVSGVDYLLFKDPFTPKTTLEHVLVDPDTMQIFGYRNSLGATDVIEKAVAEVVVPTTTTTSTTVTTSSLPVGGCGACEAPCPGGAFLSCICRARHAADCATSGGDVCFAPYYSFPKPCGGDGDCPSEPGCGGTCNYACDNGYCQQLCW